MEITTKAPSETRRFGRSLAKKARGGEIFALIGDLGGGKTCFTQGFAAGLGVHGAVTSPTFVLMKTYPVKKAGIAACCHIDAYRLRSMEDIASVGIDEYLGKIDVVTVIEWADKIWDLLTPYTITELHFSFVDNHTRIISIRKRSAYA
ncbi:MAG: tRNA (adenosine(37)-N6)-threonylcarbamoyltransferase complex ATPase subunit type 1 TsaE [Patescibacteria group bacterium]|nr:tRNA (adenosine(37)-N6)-threonylcarbamoyltransferase complex ATPase subunit type 1 TsaE [Patescibacteria group bacterium]MDD5715983.1 tRNA (adenosine(37)-N6)-threonylcarbamoyltransferase complex ATPase subunit type 1 TsaE [Patescibacteria group bacterium]